MQRATAGYVSAALERASVRHLLTRCAASSTKLRAEPLKPLQEKPGTMGKSALADLIVALGFGRKSIALQ
jgi:hypothetical protein